MTDGQLLDRFITRRDGEAFAELVRRHGPMVLAVSRRATRSEQDAEDAFQATFLVLVRKARSVKPRDSVGNWLFGVASRRPPRSPRRGVVRGVVENRGQKCRGHSRS